MMDLESRERILGILNENPDGLSIRQIFEILVSRYAVRKKN